MALVKFPLSSVSLGIWMWAGGQGGEFVDSGKTDNSCNSEGGEFKVFIFVLDGFVL